MDRLIIDGNNVMHAHPAYRGLLDEDFEAARARLVSDLSGHAHPGLRIVVVFDGGGAPGSDGTPHHLGPLTVIFSPAGTDADTVIEALASRSRSRGESAVVVTSDTATRNAVASGPIAVRSSRAFIDEMVAEAVDRSGHRFSGVQRVPVGARVESGVAETLARWARGHTPGSPAR